MTHVLDDFRNKRLVLTLRILLIEDAVLLVLESNASETVVARETERAVHQIPARPAAAGEKDGVCCVDAVAALIHVLCIAALLGIHAVFQR